ncbi:MAG: DUF6089 family protein [Bacteroidia bacterium]|jgi:hypothetical protein|nr:DUF6089 family protein [Bacteroidia bacterium]
MPKVLAILFLLLLGDNLRAQWLWDFGGNVGASNYLGDIGGKEGPARAFVSDIQLSQTRWNIGGFARYRWKQNTSIRLALDYLRVQGDDKLSTNPPRMFRNFNFRNDIFDLAFTFHYFFFENNDLGRTYRYRNGMRLYFFGGLGTCMSNPKTLYQGSWVALQPLATEGKTYSKFFMNIPLGAGAYFTFNKKHRLGIELNYRFVFSDYLDDISGNYPKDPGDDYSRGLILRTNELDEATIASNPGVYYSHDWGQKRGENTNRDSYMTLSLSYAYVLRGKASFYRIKNTGYFSKKRKMRKIRAKF